MRIFITLGLASIMLGCTTKSEEHTMQTHAQHEKHQHQHGALDTGSKLLVATDPMPPRAGDPITLRLMIHASDGTMVNDFDTVHEERVHLVIISEGLEHFAHLHPQVDKDGNLQVAYPFPAGGPYRLFADFAPRGGQPATATGSLSVDGQFVPTMAPGPNAPGEVEADGVHATITAGPLKAGSPAHISFTLRDNRGEPMTLEPYMGEAGHLMFVGIGTWRYIHVHPGGGDAEQGLVEFEAHFPESGVYKGWGQFKHDGAVKVVPFVIRVD
jgi:hypothetical protein